MEWGRVRPELLVSGRYNDVVVRRTAGPVWKMEVVEWDGGGGSGPEGGSAGQAGSRTDQ